MSDTASFRVEGDLTFDTVSTLHRQSVSWFGTGAEQVVLDFANAGRTDSAGIALMLEWIETASTRGQRLTLDNLPKQIGQFVEINGLGELFQKFTG